MFSDSGASRYSTGCKPLLQVQKSVTKQLRDSKDQCDTSLHENLRR